MDVIELITKYKIGGGMTNFKYKKYSEKIVLQYEKKEKRASDKLKLLGNDLTKKDIRKVKKIVNEILKIDSVLRGMWELKQNSGKKSNK